MYQSSNNTYAWKLLLNNMSCFNEETGELAFSVLSRAVLGDSQKSKFDHLNTMYTLLHSYMSVADDIRNDQDKVGPQRNWRKQHDFDGPEVAATKAWLSLFVRRLRYDQLVVYDGSTEAYRKADIASKHMVARKADAPMFSLTKQTALVDALLKQAKTKLEGSTWAWQMRSIWPEFEHVMPSPASALRPYAGDDLDDSEDDDEYKPMSPVSVPKAPDNGKDEACSESDPEEGSCNDAPPPRKKRSTGLGVLDVDERGEMVSWDAWLRGKGLRPGNVIPGPRSSRRFDARRDRSSEGMVRL